MNQQFFGNARLAIQRAQQLHLFFTESVLYDQFKYTAKMPQYPKIVFLQQNPFVRNLVEKQFVQFSIIDASKTTGEDNVARLAEQVQLQSTQTNGALLFGFPNNAVEAEKLDRLLDGVNLAIRFKLSESLAQKIAGSYLSCQSCGKVFNTSLPFVTPTHPGYQNNCQTPSKCALEQSSAPADQINAEVANYYQQKGAYLEYEINEEHLLYDSQEFFEKLDNAVATHIKV
ncbi:unnamed protein product [Paramecium octaurelia]|uniref:Uncharacterized protein n=1 Tax=Paramecium octaurelia TaxID=43137 RepID=A0A8S1Y3H5_PAROT|nr:unnamed protein product [Paramecium octaurelia]